MSNQNLPLSLVAYNKDGLELFVDQSTGRAYASLSAAARMLGRQKSTIQGWLASKNRTKSIPAIEAQIQTRTGLKTVRLLSSDLVFGAALRYNPTLAEQMGSAGANVYMLGLAGYETRVAPAQAAAEKPKPQVEQPQQSGRWVKDHKQSFINSLFDGFDAEDRRKADGETMRQINGLVSDCETLLQASQILSRGGTQRGLWIVEEVYERLREAKTLSTPSALAVNDPDPDRLNR